MPEQHSTDLAGRDAGPLAGRGGFGGASSPLVFAFTDIEGSSALWEKVPEPMSAALALHDQVIRALLLRHGGVEVKTEGDAFMATFSQPAQAVAWALELQRALLAVPWPEAILRQTDPPEAAPDLWRGLRVRVGLHLGEAFRTSQQNNGATDYLGPNVNRAARTAAAAHGGQVLVTDALWEALSGEDRERLALVEQDLGQYRFRGMEEPERLHQVLPRSLAARTFGALRADPSRRTNLRPDPTSFVGRDAELRELDRLLADGARLITLLGPGGMGKTRLSREWAGRQVARMSQHGGGVWFCDLSECWSESALAQTVASALGLALPARQSESADQIGHVLRGRGRMLLVLDNLEQITALARATARDWLAAAPDLVILATSREVLQLPAEHVVRVEPLLREDGVALFVERAARRGARLDLAAEGEPLGRLVGALDGLPLAIELAAGRASSLSPAAMLHRLSRRGSLGRPDLDRPARHATLQASMAWSWELLSPAQRDALSRCTVFCGGFTLDAAEAMLAVSEDDDLDAADLIEDLTNRSLLRTVDGPEAGPARRYQMLEYIRNFVFDIQPPSPDLEARHAAWYVALGERLVHGLEGRDGRRCFTLLNLERDNLAVIVERRAGTADALRAALVLDAILERIGPYDERLRRLDELLPSAHRHGDPTLLVGVLIARGQALGSLGQVEAADQAFRDALAALGERQDSRQRGLIWRGVAMAALDLRRYTEAEAAFQEALRWVDALPDARATVLLNAGVLARRQGDPAGAELRYRDAQRAAQVAGSAQLEGLALNNLGVLKREAGRFEEASGYAWQALAKFRECGDQGRQGLALNNLAILATELRRPDHALEMFAEALSHFRQVGNRGGEAGVLNNLAVLRLEQRRLPEARSRAAEALGIYQGLGSTYGAAVSHGLLGMACAAADQLTEALGWLAAAVEGFEAGGHRYNLAYHAALLGAVLADLGSADEAQRRFEQVDAELQANPTPVLQDVLRVCRAHLDLTERGADGAERLLQGYLAAHPSPAQELRRALDLLRDAARRLSG